MRRFLLLSLVALATVIPVASAPLPPELAEALRAFRTDGPKGWRYIQTTRAGNQSLVERFDPAQPDFRRWSLLEKDGRPPTAEETRTYLEGKTRRSAGQTAPRIQDRFDEASAEAIRREGEHSWWRFRLTPGAADDQVAQHMTATLTFHEPSRTIEQVEIASLGPYSPVFAVRITESRTVMNYSRPSSNRPSLLQTITLRLRGRAFWFKSLDEDMTVTFSDYEKAGK